MITAFDHSILHALNAHVGQSPGLDAIIVMFQRNPLLKGAPLVMPLLFAWFTTLGDVAARLRRRQLVFAGFCAMMVALTIARIIANLAPYRVRPILDPSLHLTLPGGLTPENGSHWSAFPSDHAAVWFALAATIWRLDRRCGLLALLFAALLGLMRVYVAFHSPSDIIVGGLIGIAAVITLTRAAPRAVLYRLVEPVELRWPGLFYTGLFLLAYQVTTMFTETRWLARLLLDLLTGDGVAAFPAD